MPTFPQLTRTRAVACAFLASAGFAAFGAAQDADAAFSTSFNAGHLVLTGDAEDDKVQFFVDPKDTTQLAVDFGFNGTIDQRHTFANFTHLDIKGGAGSDTVLVRPDFGDFSKTKLTSFDGGAGPDIYVGADGPEIIAGGPDDDTLLGAGGKDVFVWNPGDSSDFLDGEEGSDTFDFNGSSSAEEVTVDSTPNGGVRVFRDIGAAAQDVHGVELIGVATGGGRDTISAGGLEGRVKLTINSGQLADTVLGSDGDDVISGGSENDVIDGRGGADTINGNLGDDSLDGAAGTDTLDGGPGADRIACGGLGDSIVADPLDTLAADCLPPPPPPPPPPPVELPPAGPAPATAPAPADPATTPPAGTGAPPATGPTPGTGTPTPPPPANIRGFAKPRVRATRSGLAVTLKSTSAKTITVKLTAVERGRAYKALKRKIAPGARLTVKLKAPRALRASLARALVRRPKLTVLNVATGGSATVRPKLSVRAAVR
jgi:hypothetical protein